MNTHLKMSGPKTEVVGVTDEVCKFHNEIFLICTFHRINYCYYSDIKDVSVPDEEHARGRFVVRTEFCWETHREEDGPLLGRKW